MTYTHISKDRLPNRAKTIILIKLAKIACVAMQRLPAPLSQIKREGDVKTVTR